MHLSADQIVCEFLNALQGVDATAYHCQDEGGSGWAQPREDDPDHVPFVVLVAKYMVYFNDSKPVRMCEKADQDSYRGLQVSPSVL